MNELMNVKVEKINGTLVTTSNRVAEELEVEHKNLLTKIDDYREKFGGLSFSHEFYIESVFENRGKQYRNYLITEKGIAQLVGGYSAAVPKAFNLNVAYINEFERMRNALTGGKVPSSFKEALQLALEQEEKLEALRLENKAQAQKITEDRPKVLFADAVSSSDTSILIGDLAKILKQNGYNTGQKRLFEDLRNSGFLMKSGSSRNMPTQKSMEMGLFEVKETTINNPDGSIRITKTTKCSGKGQQYFINYFLGRKAAHNTASFQTAKA